jgi:membrane-associated phospholipid phosphatase
MGAPENLLELPKDMTSLYIYHGDLFFSGHVGGPFLFGLIFWHDKMLRLICLIAAAFFSIVVLLGGIHYSIDVFASYFIAHSIFTLSKKIFSQDYLLLLNHSQR